MLESVSISRCSLVVRALDSWTGRPVAGASLRVRIAGSMAKPLRTSEGSWAFMDLRGSACEVTIDSDIYRSFRMEIDLTALPATMPVVTACLQPGRRYPPPPAATGVIRRLVDDAGKPLAGARAVAYADDDQAARGRIFDEEAPAGSMELRYVPGMVPPMNGDALAFRDKAGATAEWFRAFPQEEQGKAALRLDRPLTSGWKRHTALLPAAVSASDEDGWLVLPFRGPMPAACPIHVRLQVGERTMEAHWPLEGGKTSLLPDFVWSSRV